MFSATSYFWPLLIGFVLFGFVLLVAVVVFGFTITRRSSATSPAVVPVPVPETHLAAKRLSTIVAEADLHAADRAVLDSVAAKLEPTPITREGMQAMIAAMKPPETPA